MSPKKATAEQYKQLIHLTKKSEVLKWGKGTPEMKKDVWEHISQVLNSIGGVEKNSESWRKVKPWSFIEWKSHIKAKIRQNKPLNEAEKICADVTGLFVICSGINNVEELGLRAQRTGHLETDTEVDTREDDVKTEEILIEITENEPIEDAIDNSGNLESSVVVDQQLPGKIEIKGKSCLKSNPKTTKLLSNEHIRSTNAGLQEIAKSIRAVADSINNLAFAMKNMKQ